MTRYALPLALGLAATAAQAEVYPPRPVEAGWPSVAYALPDVEGVTRITWTTATSTGGVVVVCGAWASDDPALDPIAAIVLAQARTSEAGRELLQGATHFTRAGSTDALTGTEAACAPTTATSAGAVAFAPGDPGPDAMDPPAPAAPEPAAPEVPTDDSVAPGNEIARPAPAPEADADADAEPSTEATDGADAPAPDADGDAPPADGAVLPSGDAPAPPVEEEGPPEDFVEDGE